MPGPTATFADGCQAEGGSCARHTLWCKKLQTQEFSDLQYKRDIFLGPITGLNSRTPLLAFLIKCSPNCQNTFQKILCFMKSSPLKIFVKEHPPIPLCTPELPTHALSYQTHSAQNATSILHCSSSTSHALPRAFIQVDFI